MAKAEYRSAARSRQMIVAALAALLQEKPLDKITVTDVVTKANINRGTFYAHYANIPDVINSLVDESFQSIRLALDGQCHNAEDIPHILVTQIKLLVQRNTELVQAITASSISSLFQDQLCNLTLDYALAYLPPFSGDNQQEHILNLRFCAGGLSNLYSDWFAGKIPMTLDQLTMQAERILQKIMLQTV